MKCVFVGLYMNDKVITVLHLPITAIDKSIIKPYLQAAVTAAALYMGWLRSTTIPQASSLTYLKCKNMSVFYYTVLLKCDFGQGTDKPCTCQWLITATWLEVLYHEQLNGSSAVPRNSTLWNPKFHNNQNKIMPLEPILSKTSFKSGRHISSSWSLLK